MYEQAASFCYIYKSSAVQLSFSAYDQMQSGYSGSGYFFYSSPGPGLGIFFILGRIRVRLFIFILGRVRVFFLFDATLDQIRISEVHTTENQC